MKNNERIELLKAFAMALAFLVMMFVSLSSYRVFDLCKEKGGVYFVGMIVGCIGVVLFYFSQFFFNHFMDKWKITASYKVWAFVFSLVLIISFVCYIIFFDLDAVMGRDVTIEIFIVLAYMVMAIIGLVKTIKDKW